MRPLLIIAALFCCAGVGPDAGQDKNAPADWANAKNVFIGWVNISLDDWLPLGYDNVQDWSVVIDRNNLTFQSMFRQKLPERQIAGAKNKSDENASEQGLYVRFSEVRFDVNSYRLFLSIHFVDPQSGSELASVPLKGYRGGHFSVNSCLEGALEKVADEVTKQIRRSAKK